MNMTDYILIEGLKVETVIGCFDWERQILQPLLIDLHIAVSLAQASISDDLQHTLNYAEICDLTTTVIVEAQPKLIEHVAKLVIDRLFNQYQAIEKIKITVRKPAIIPAAQSVGIQIERQRDYLRHYYSE